MRHLARGVRYSHPRRRRRMVGDEFGSKKRAAALAALSHGAGAIVQGLALSLGVLIMWEGSHTVPEIGLCHAAPHRSCHRGDPRRRLSGDCLYPSKRASSSEASCSATWSSYVIFGQDEGWRSLLSTPAVPAALLMLGMSRLPDSPRWLLQRGRPASEAREALEQVRGKKASRDIVDAEMARMVSSDHHVGGIQRAVQAREPAAPVHRHLRRALPADNRSTERRCCCAKQGIHQRRIHWRSGWSPGGRCHPWFLQAP